MAKFGQRARARARSRRVLGPMSRVTKFGQRARARARSRRVLGPMSRVAKFGQRARARARSRRVLGPCLEWRSSGNGRGLGRVHEEFWAHVSSGEVRATGAGSGAFTKSFGPMSQVAKFGQRARARSRRGLYLATSTLYVTLSLSSNTIFGCMLIIVIPSRTSPLDKIRPLITTFNPPSLVFDIPEIV